MNSSAFVEEYHSVYGEPNVIRDADNIAVSVPEEFGDDLYINADEPFVWVKIALIQYHVREAE